VRILDKGRRLDVAFPDEKGSSRGKGETTGGFADRERPYIDDQPASRRDWESRSRWGPRPVREHEREIGRGMETLKDYIKRAWARVEKALDDAR